MDERIYELTDEVIAEVTADCLSLLTGLYGVSEELLAHVYTDVTCNSFGRTIYFKAVIERRVLYGVRTYGVRYIFTDVVYPYNDPEGYFLDDHGFSLESAKVYK